MTLSEQHRPWATERRLREAIQELVAAAIERDSAREHWDAMVSRVAQVQTDLRVSDVHELVVQHLGNYWLVTKSQVGWNITPIAALLEEAKVEGTIGNGTP